MVDDLTLDEFAVIEKDLGANWVTFNPFLSSMHARATLITFLARSIGTDAATRKVGALSLKEAVACFEAVKDDLPDVYEDGIPKPEAEPETNGSPGAPSGSDGPRA